METLSKPLTRPVGRRVMIAPNRYAIYTGPSGKTHHPRTRLGMLAQQLSQQTTISVLSIAATSGYVYALTQAAAPNIQFTSVPPGMNSSVAQLQQAYTNFLTQFALFQGQAGAWINTQQGTGTPSIFSQLVSVPNTLNDINGTVTSNFTLLNTYKIGSPQYEQTLQNQETLIGATQPAITSLIQAMTTLGANLQNAASTLIASSQTGTLSQLLTAYAADIQTLQNDIDSCNSQISSDNAKIIGLGFAAAASIAVGLLGLMNIWNPFGWIMLAGGATGAAFAIMEIGALQVEIAALKNKIQSDTSYLNQDQAAASLVAAFCNQLKGFASMNQAAQQELTTLENLYNTLSTEITAALSNLDDNELALAQQEWNTVLQTSQFLENLTAYIWPNPIMLSSPSSFAAVGNDLYCLSLSGELFHYSGGTWTDMGTTALSIAGFGTMLVAIDGAPINGTAVSPNPTASTFFVKLYNTSTKTWSTISTFPAAAIAVGDGGIYAINQLTSDRQVYQYSGSGTSWTKLTALPGPDAASQIAVSSGYILALSNNGQQVWYYDAVNSCWGLLSPFTCAKLLANGNMAAVLGTDNTEYLYKNSSQPTTMGTGMIQVAQLTTGDQYGIDSNLNLWLNEFGNPITHTQLATNVTTVFASDTNAVYYTDNLGNLYSLSASGQSIKLPAMP